MSDIPPVISNRYAKAVPCTPLAVRARTLLVRGRIEGTMGNVRSITILGLAMVACGNQGQISSGGGTGPGIDAGTITPGPFDSPAPLCPPDPDCFAGGQCELECPDFWTCELLSESTLR